MAEVKKEVAIKQETGVVSWEEQLKHLAFATAESEKPAGNWVSFKSGVLTIGGNPMKGNKVEMIVLHSVFENQMYANKYDANNPQPPICYALGETDDELAPHADSAKPQATSCAVCPNNDWGSDPGGGRGKACKNTRRLGIIAAPDAKDAVNVAKAEVAMAKLPVTSVKNWATYANQVVNALHLPPLAVITEMELSPDPKTQIQVNFRLVDKILDSGVLQALLKKRGDIHSIMYAPYDKPSETPALATDRKY